MRTKFLYFIFSIILAMSILIAIAFIINYFSNIITFEPVKIKISGLKENMLKQTTVVGYTPKGRVLVFQYQDSTDSFQSYYCFLASIGIRFPSAAIDSIDSIHVRTGREEFNYSKNQIDSTWSRSVLKTGGQFEIKSPPSLKTKETKIRIIATTRYWQLIKTVSLFMMAILVFVIILVIIRIVRRK